MVISNTQLHAPIIKEPRCRYDSKILDLPPRASLETMCHANCFYNSKTMRFLIYQEALKRRSVSFIETADVINMTTTRDPISWRKGYKNVLASSNTTNGKYFVSDMVVEGFGLDQGALVRFLKGLKAINQLSAEFLSSGDGKNGSKHLIDVQKVILSVKLNTSPTPHWISLLIEIHGNKYFAALIDQFGKTYDHYSDRFKLTILNALKSTYGAANLEFFANEKAINQMPNACGVVTCEVNHILLDAQDSFHTATQLGLISNQRLHHRHSKNQKLYSKYPVINLNLHDTEF